jgi:hypothetical protein
LLLWLITTRLPALDFTCTTNRGAITIIGYTGPDKALILPGKINGLPVTRIGEGAFSHSSNLTSIKIPNSITTIGLGAFQGFSGVRYSDLIEVYKAPTVGSRVTAASGTVLWTERMMLPLAKVKCSSPAVLVLKTNTSGPWSLGICLTFELDPAQLEGRPAGMGDVARWRVFNIHAENFSEITKRLGLKSVQAEIIHKGLRRQTTISNPGQETVQMVDEADCIIIDPRIPKEWLRSAPCTCYSKADWRHYLATYPDKFNVAEEN